MLSRKVGWLMSTKNDGESCIAPASTFLSISNRSQSVCFSEVFWYQFVSMSSVTFLSVWQVIFNQADVTPQTDASFSLGVTTYLQLRTRDGHSIGIHKHDGSMHVALFQGTLNTQKPCLVSTVVCMCKPWNYRSSEERVGERNTLYIRCHFRVQSAADHFLKVSIRQLRA